MLFIFILLIIARLMAIIAIDKFKTEKRQNQIVHTPPPHTYTLLKSFKRLPV